MGKAHVELAPGCPDAMAEIHVLIYMAARRERSIREGGRGEGEALTLSFKTRTDTMATDHSLTGGPRLSLSNKQVASLWARQALPSYSEN